MSGLQALGVWGRGAAVVGLLVLATPARAVCDDTDTDAVDTDSLDCDALEAGSLAGGSSCAGNSSAPATLGLVLLPLAFRRRKG